MDKINYLCDTIETIHCRGVSYKTAPAEIRGRLAFDDEKKAAILKELSTRGAQCVLVATCCRTELYYTVNAEVTDGFVQQLLSLYSGIETGELLTYIKMYQGEGALRHCFRLCGGLCSALLGEDEILRQVKADYAFACEHGAVGPSFNRIFQAAVACGKKIRTDTPIARLAVSYSTLAANAAVQFGQRVLVIGASGETGLAIVKNLIAHKGVKVTAALRSHSFNILLPESVERVSFEDRYAAAAQADVIISATKSPHYTVTLHGLEKHGITGEKLFIDLSVPADIDAAVGERQGFKLMAIDDFKAMVGQNTAARQSSAEVAEHIAKTLLQALEKELVFNSYLDREGEIVKTLKNTPEKALHRLKRDLDPQALKTVLEILSGV